MQAAASQPGVSGGTASPPQFHTFTRYLRKHVARGFMRSYIRGLVSWTPMSAPREGYTVILGCAHRLASLLNANLVTLSRQNLTSCDRVLVVVDAERHELSRDFEVSARGVAPGLAVEFLYYDARQVARARRIDWGWIYAWMSWSIGIGATRTRYALLHDFDALLLRNDILEERYAQIRARGVEYLGVGNYTGLGVVPEDGLVKTFELMFDAAFVRERHAPIDLFNRMATFRGRRVEFDTFLWAQSRAGRTSVLEIHETDMVHPSQMICQYVDYRNARHVPPANNLLMVPYYEYLGGDSALLRDLADQMSAGNGRSVRLWGRALDVGGIPPVHAQWICKQGLRLESALGGGARPDVVRYFDGIRRCVEGGTSA